MIMEVEKRKCRVMPGTYCSLLINCDILMKMEFTEKVQSKILNKETKIPLKDAFPMDLLKNPLEFDYNKINCSKLDSNKLLRMMNRVITNLTNKFNIFFLKMLTENKNHNEIIKVLNNIIVPKISDVKDFISNTKSNPNNSSIREKLVGIIQNLENYLLKIRNEIFYEYTVGFLIKREKNTINFTHRCGHIIYYNPEIHQNLINLCEEKNVDETMKNLSIQKIGKCENCGEMLNYEEFNLKIGPYISQYTQEILLGVFFLHNF